MTPDIGPYQSATMAAKLRAVPLPDLAGATVLDVGCDHGAWCWLAAERGAARVVGIDRGRDGMDLAERNASVNRYAQVEFRALEIGRQWPELGRFDLVLLLNLYHHIYEVCGDHHSIWFWLWRQTAGQLLWESPTDTRDSVVQMNVTRPYHLADILSAASEWFHVERVGPGHVATREVWRCTPKRWAEMYSVELLAGAGGAAPAFEYAGGRRMDEIETALGVRPIPGSLNVRTDLSFHWDRGYYRAQVLDVDRSAGLGGQWTPRWARFYPLRDCWAFRFEGETYPDNFVELIAPHRLRDTITGWIRT